MIQWSLRLVGSIRGLLITHSHLGDGLMPRVELRIHRTLHTCWGWGVGGYDEKLITEPHSALWWVCWQHPHCSSQPCNLDDASRRYRGRLAWVIGYYVVSLSPMIGNTDQECSAPIGSCLLGKLHKQGSCGTKYLTSIWGFTLPLTCEVFIFDVED